MGGQVGNGRPAPAAEANRVTRILDTVFPGDRFPVNVAEVALEISHQRFPDEPITAAMGDDLPGFEGALVRSPSGRKGWGIFYNSAVSSAGRINFTLGHEFGHYLLHRHAYPDGIQCEQRDMFRWNSPYYQIEQEANKFAATLLMPLNDYRQVIDPGVRPTLEDLSACAERYGVSLIAAVLRWLEYTTQCSVLVVSRDGFILWARSSPRAFKSGLYFKTVDRPPVEVPPPSLAAEAVEAGAPDTYRELDAGHWFRRAACQELALRSDRYDFTISLLHAEAPARFDDALPESVDEPEAGDGRNREFGLD